MSNVKAPMQNSSDTGKAAFRLGPLSRFDERSQSSGACVSRGNELHSLIMQLSAVSGVQQRWEGRTNEGSMMPGDLSILPAGMPLHWEWGSAANSQHLSFAPELLSSMADDLWNCDSRQLELHDTAFQFRDGHISFLARSIHWDARKGDATSVLRAEANAERLAHYMLMYYSNIPTRPPKKPGLLPATRVNAVMDYIETFLDGPLHLDDLARAAKAERFSFAKMFRRTLGKSPHQYVLERRLERAKGLMLTTDMSLTEIAVMIGFFDQAHFSRHFGMLFGVSPRRWRLSVGSRRGVTPTYQP